MSEPETPIAALNEHGVTWHQTTPLKRAGYTTAESVADLVTAHHANPHNSPLAAVTGMGQTRITAVCNAVQSWRSAATDDPQGNTR